MTKQQLSEFERQVSQQLRVHADQIDGGNDPPGYAARVRELEEEGLTTSDAQGVADAEFAKLGGGLWGS